MRLRLFPFLLPFLPLIAYTQRNLPAKVFLPDSATASASFQYKPQSFLHRFLMGSNYREQWQMQVRVPVFQLSASPFTIGELGGGMQTKSLQLKDAQGKHWALRTVEKDVRAALPKLFRNTLARRGSQDLISAAMPYGAVVVGELAFSAGITAARPQVVLVKADKSLDGLKEPFADALCLLEERDPYFDSTVTTTAMVQTVERSAFYRVDQKAFLKARLFDMLIADWDRHGDNWRWGLRDSAGLKWWIPVPRDRDWAFYQSGGAMPWLARQLKVMRFLVNFLATPKNLKDQSWKAWMMDKVFLNELTQQDWENGVEELQALLTDTVIESAVRAVPASIYQSIGATMVANLKSRRDGMRDEVLKYYRFQAEDVLIEGSDEAEIFTIASRGDTLLVEATANTQRVYQRSFLYPETISITINGKGGDNVFVVDEKASSRIRLKFIGAKGKDAFNGKGKLRVKIQDDSDE